MVDDEDITDSDEKISLLRFTLTDNPLALSVMEKHETEVTPPIPACHLCDPEISEEGRPSFIQVCVNNS